MEQISRAQKGNREMAIIRENEEEKRADKKVIIEQIINEKFPVKYGLKRLLSLSGLNDKRHTMYIHPGKVSELIIFQVEKNDIGIRFAIYKLGIYKTEE